MEEQPVEDNPWKNNPWKNNPWKNNPWKNNPVLAGTPVGSLLLLGPPELERALRRVAMGGTSPRRR